MSESTTPRGPGYPYGEFDAVKWAEEFKRLFPESDEGLMIGWFANAIMTGYDTAHWRLARHRALARRQQAATVLEGLNELQRIRGRMTKVTADDIVLLLEATIG